MINLKINASELYDLKKDCVDKAHNDAEAFVSIVERHIKDLNVMLKSIKTPEDNKSDVFAKAISKLMDSVTVYGNLATQSCSIASKVTRVVEEFTQEKYELNED